MSGLARSDVVEHEASGAPALAGGDDPDADRIEVRLLGPLQVRRADGSLVHPREWRTGKTVDLLRLLATRPGVAVSVDEILEALWPNVDEHHGRGSLRNAVGHLRKLLGPQAIERRPDGLVLRDAWVDTTALMALADEARRHGRHGRLALAVTVAREADALHLGEFRTHDPDALWAVPVRENLEARFREMTLDAAEHAVELGWMRDALELGQRALQADSTSERAYRVLMRAFAGLGETERALRTYERCRAVLAEDLGIDPSPQTRALHLEILSSEPVGLPTAPFTGRESELEELDGWLRERSTTGVPGVLYLSGAVGSGRERLLREAAERAGASVGVVPADRDVVDAVQRACLAGSTQAPRAGRGGVVLLVPVGDRLPPGRRSELLDALGSLQGPVTVALRLSDNAEALLARDQEAADEPTDATSALHLLPLPPTALEQLATALLGGPPTQGLLEVLAARSEALPGRVVTTVDEWFRGGEVAATSQGLALVPPHDRSETATEQGALLVRAMEQTGPRDQHVLHLVAVLDRPVSPALLAPLMPAAPASTEPSAEDVASVLASLDRLVDLQLLVTTPQGHTLRDPFLRQAVESWLRPSVRRRLHALVAERARIPAAERGRHWRAAGEVELATASAFDAVRAAMADGDVAGARLHLLVVTDLAERTHVGATDLAELEESLADVCLEAARVDEAVQHYCRAADLLDTIDPAEAERLRERAEGARSRLARTAGRAQPQIVEPVAPAPDTDRDDEALERAAWTAVRAADAAENRGERVATRLHLVREHLLPSRRLARAREVGAQAVALAEEGPARAEAVVTHHLADVILGNGRLAEPELDAAWTASDQRGPAAGRLAVARCLAGHDLGRRDFDARWQQAMTLCPPDEAECDWTWARVRILTERGSLAEAIEEDRRPVPDSASTVERQLRALAGAGLLAALGRAPEGVGVLREALSEAEEEGCSLLLPEVTARLVVLTALTDRAAAVAYFELFDWAVGSELAQPREGYLRLLARSAVRAGHQELDRAAAAAANAARIAQESGLVLLASEAYLAQAQYLFEGGWSAGARVATAGAARCLRAAGTVG